MVDFGQNTITNRQAVLDLFNSVSGDISGFNQVQNTQGSLIDGVGSLITVDDEQIVTMPIQITTPVFVIYFKYWGVDYNADKWIYGEVTQTARGAGTSVQSMSSGPIAGGVSEWRLIQSQFQNAYVVLDNNEAPLYPQLRIYGEAGNTINWYVSMKIVYPQL